jgi:chromosome segregation ATPase
MPDGTTDEAGRSSEKSGQSSNESKNPSEPRTYTQIEVDQLVKERHSKLDSQIATLTKEKETLAKEKETLAKERDSFKSQAEEATQKAEQATTAREEAEKELDTAVAGDASQEEILKLRRELRSTIAAEKAAIKKERESLAREKETHGKEWQTQAERIKKAEQAEWDGIVFEAAKAVGGDAAKLKEKAAEFEITDPEKLKKLANTLWPMPVVKPDSGRTAGGGGDLNKMSGKDLLIKGFSKKS